MQYCLLQVVHLPTDPFALHPTTQSIVSGLLKVSTITPGWGTVVEYHGDYLGTASFAHACAVAVGFYLPG